MEENVIQINSAITIIAKQNVFEILKMEKYLASTMDNSAIICDEVIETYSEEVKTVSTNFNEKM